MCGMQDFEDDEVPILSERGRGEGFMEEAPATGSGAAAREEKNCPGCFKIIPLQKGGWRPPPPPPSRKTTPHICLSYTAGAWARWARRSSHHRLCQVSNPSAFRHRAG